MVEYVTCAIEDCNNEVRARGWCPKHYKRWREHGNPMAGGTPRRVSPPPPCAHSDCDKPARARGYCYGHYQAWKYHGFDEAKRPSPRVVTRRLNRLGYVEWTEHNHPSANRHGVVLEHRAVMEEKIGRQLVKGENVHHINGNRSDNRPENLELWVTLQPSGQRPRDLLAYAREIIARYEGCQI